MSNQFRNLVFEGGGVKGIAYVGAMQVLQDKGILDQIQRVGGTSAGAINAVLMGLHYTVRETREILSQLNFNNFLDDSWGMLRDTDRLITEYGWYKGDSFRDWIGRLIREKTGNSESTFGEIDRKKKEKGFKDIFLMGTNLSTRFAEVFSHEHTPRMCVADATRISMSIPLFFKAQRSPRGDVYVDGGVLDNYPIKLFDRKKYLSTDQAGQSTEYYEAHNKKLKDEGKDINEYIYNKETLGFRLDSAKEIAVFRDHAEPDHQKIGDFFSYAWALVDTILESQQSYHLHSDDWHRTVYIDTLGVKTTEFDLSDQKKKELEGSGRAGALKYFEWFENNTTHNKLA